MIKDDPRQRACISRNGTILDFTVFPSILSEYPLVKKIGIFALVALVVIPASVMAAGYQAAGAGSGGISAGGQQSGHQSGAGQNRPSNQHGIDISKDKGNGTSARNQTQRYLQNRFMTQLQTTTQTQTQNQDQSHAITRHGSSSRPVTEIEISPRPGPLTDLHPDYFPSQRPWHRPSPGARKGFLGTVPGLQQLFNQLIN